MSTTDPRTLPLIATFRLDTRLLENCFDDLDEAQALHRPASADGEKLNNMAFLAAHLADARRYLANMLGPEVANPFPELADGTGIDDFPELPKVERLLAALREMGEVLDERLGAATAEQLDADAPIDFGTDDKSLLGGIAFLLHHESYHAGQLAYLRRLAGLPAMKYD
jgi:uncharacterized damage-inducible protein DinB